MDNLHQLIDYSAQKTRVLIYSTFPTVTQLFASVLDFNGKEFALFSDAQSFDFPERDFVVFETSNLDHAVTYHPNIVLVTDETPALDILMIAENIVPGGILIYPESLTEKLDESDNFFRKISFAETPFETDSENVFLSTDMGVIPLRSNDQHLVRNITGIRLLAQQLSVMQDEFYDAAMSFGETTG